MSDPNNRTFTVPRTVNDFMAMGMSSEQAQHKVRQDVFGHDYKTDAKGNPIEQGLGSALNPTSQHKAALAREQRPSASVGYHPGLEHAYDPRMERAPRRKQARRAAKKAAPAQAQATPDEA